MLIVQIHKDHITVIAPMVMRGVVPIVTVNHAFCLVLLFRIYNFDVAIHLIITIDFLWLFYK